MMLDFFNHVTATTIFLLKQEINRRSLQNPPCVILGLSGGPDSVFLLHILAKLQEQGLLTIIAAHLDHGWRASSTTDAAFCQQLCKQLNITYHQAHAATIHLTKKHNGSQEALGRALRQTFFQQIAQQYHATFIALAHHAQDQQETFFIRLFRGSTLDGLCSMKTSDDMYFRPLLQVNKSDILDYLHANNIAYCIDPTNTSESFLRNRIRKYIIPATNLCDSRFNKTFQQTLELLQQENLFLHDLAQKAYNDVFAAQPENKNRRLGSKKALEDQHPVLQNRIIILWLIKEQAPCTISYAFVQEILKFLLNPRGGTHNINLHWSITKQRDIFWIVHKQN